MAEDPSSINSDSTYSPAALLHIFNGLLAPAQTKKLIRLKGVYRAGKGALYGGYYYDVLVDETAEAQLTLIVPARLRPSLTDNTTIEFQGYVTKRVALAQGRIEIQATITELLEERVNKYTSEELRAVAIQQQKADQGFRDVEGFLKSRIAKREPVRVVILVGKTAIVDSDIRHALEGSVGFYQVRFERIGMTSEAEILEALQRFDDPSETDVLVLSRGGGDRMEVFDSPVLAEYCLGLEPLFVTAFGHKEDSSLLQRIADKAFITPTALGQYLNTLHNDTIAELEHSKAKLVATITEQLKANYAKQVENLEAKVKQLEELGGRSAGVQQQEVQVLRGQVALVKAQAEEAGKQLERERMTANAYRSRVDGLKAGRLAYWVAIVILVLVCVVVGRGCGHG
jgi:exodeoxyribonuclease VII large subunit